MQNKAYVGLREINKVHKHRDQEHLKPFQKHSVVPASWPAIVDKETFDVVQSILQRNREGERSRLEGAAERVFLVSNICRCNEYGKSLTGQSAHGRNKVHRYYSHSTKKGDVVPCTVKRQKADEIENGLISHLVEILIRAGYFDKIANRIKETSVLNPEVRKAEKVRLQNELSKLTTAIKNTFRFQAELGDNSDALKEVAAEMRDLSQKKKAAETALENLKAQDNIDTDVDDAIDDLKERIDSFRRGYAKATAMNRKSLIEGLIHAIAMTPEGLLIEYRLKHGLNSSGTTSGYEGCSDAENNLCDLDAYRKTNSPLAMSETDPWNQGIGGSRVVGIGSERRLH